MLDYRLGNVLNWVNRRPDKLRIAHNEKVENSQKPSMWEYNPKGGMPTELANLDSRKFFTNRLGQILCSLPRDVFIRICAMFDPRDFVRLSLTCRFLHWRMFTFCTCYYPWNVEEMWIHDEPFDEDRCSSPNLTYILNKGVISDVKDHNGRPPQYFRHHPPSNRFYTVDKEDGERGIFVSQPFRIRKPFFFKTVNLTIYFPFFCKTYYDWCLPYILAVRGLTRHLEITFRKHYYSIQTVLNFSDINDFLTAINASSYNYIEEAPPRGTEMFYLEEWRNNIGIYVNCPYASQMHRVCILEGRDNMRNIPIFENSIGIYRYASNNAIIATLLNFFTGSTNLLFHQYLDIEEDNGRFHLIEFLFEKFGEFEEEFFYETDRPNSHSYYVYYYHIWKKLVEADNGERLRIIITKRHLSGEAAVKIGKATTFEQIDYGFSITYYHGRNSLAIDSLWKMETAVEPDGTEKLGVVAEPAVAVESDVTVAVESDGTENSDETEESDEAEEEQGASRVCLCLNNISCSIQ